MCKIVTNHSFVYLIGYEDRIKIGKSNNPEARLSALQTAIPETLEIRGLLGCDNEEKALALEKELHSQYKECSLRGEWFNLNQAEVDYLLDTYSAIRYITIPQAEITRALGELSQGAFRLLTYYYSRRDGWVFVDDNIAKTLDTSVRMIKKYRKELITKDYLLIQKGEVDVYFIGLKSVRQFVNGITEDDDYENFEPIVTGKK